MASLNTLLSEGIHDLVQGKYKRDASLTNLANTIIDNEADFEHVVTFLDESPSGMHQDFGADLRRLFEEVLRKQLDRIKDEVGDDPVDLYTALFDMHNVTGMSEVLGGVLTTNYDLYIEQALAGAGFGPIDFGFPVRNADPEVSTPLVKLHGSFGWTATWPPSVRTRDTGDDGPTLWIPPGIQKPKQGYPFNVLWGFAREVLACDVLRIIGCRLDGNDWDLISLLFSTLHVKTNYQPYRVEVIDAPSHAQAIQERFPYLAAQSILDLPDTGRQLIAEYTGRAPREYIELDEDEQRAVVATAGTKRNWFEVWLRQQAEFLFSEHGTVDTPNGVFAKFLEA